MEAEQQGNDLGLSHEEKAFYDALTRPQAVKDFYSNDQLVALTKDLTDMLRKNRTIDWNRREAERANMRRLLRIRRRHILDYFAMMRGWELARSDVGKT